MSHLRVVILLFAAATMLSACNVDYWWSRGQAPSVQTLIERSSEKLNTAQAGTKTDRADLVALSETIELNLLAAVALSNGTASTSDVRTHLAATKTAFIALEGKLTPGSRPPYGELSSQLRAIVAQSRSNGSVDADGLGLFTARTMFFLADELSV